MDRGAWWATVHEVTKSQTRLRDSHTNRQTHTHTQLRGKEIVVRKKTRRKERVK